MAKKRKEITDLSEVKTGDVYKAPDGTTHVIGRIVKRFSDASKGDVYEDEDGHRTLIRSVREPSPAEIQEAAEKAQRKTIAQQERETRERKKPTAKPRRSRAKPPEEKGKPGPKPKKPKKEPGVKKEPKPRKPAPTGPTKKKDKHWYIMCPLCGWWYITEYVLKANGKRDAHEEKVRDFRIGLDGNPSTDPPSSVYHSRKLRGAGRGSPNASITVEDLTDVDGIPQWLVDHILEQLNYVYAVLSAPVGTRLGLAKRLRPVGAKRPATPTYKPKHIAPAKAEEEEKELEPTLPTPPPVKKKEEPPPTTEPETRLPSPPLAEVSVSWRWLPRNWIYYSSSAAQGLLEYVDDMKARNVPIAGEKQPPGIAMGDIKNLVILREYRDVVDMLSRWLENFVGAPKIGRVLRTIDKELSSTEEMPPPHLPAEHYQWKEYHKRSAGEPAPNLARLNELLEELVALSPLASEGVGSSTREELEEEMGDIRLEVEEINERREELSRKSVLSQAEEVELKGIADKLERKQAQAQSIAARLEDIVR